MRGQLGDARLFGNELCPNARELAPLALELVALDLDDDQLLLDVGLRGLSACCALLDLGFADGEVARGCELPFVCLDLVLESIAEPALALERRLELGTEPRDLGRLVAHGLGQQREDLSDRQELGDLRRNGLDRLDDFVAAGVLAGKLARELRAQPRAESGFRLVRHLKWR
jgi:hypothetical protein